MPDTSQEEAVYSATLKFLTLVKKQPLEEHELLAEAMFAAAEFHGDQRRKSGQLYVAHLLTVATLLLKEGADTQTVMAGLLHDVLEDTDTGEAALEQRFGPEVTKLVEGCSKSKIFSNKENLEKIYQKSRQDPRIAWIKVADRCANLMNGSALALSAKSHLENLQETAEFHLPLLSEIPSVPTGLVQLLKRSLEQSWDDYRTRTRHS